jgi:hypothetical protein
MNDTHRENGTMAGPLIFTVPAYGFVMALYLDCLGRTPARERFPLPAWNAQGSADQASGGLRIDRTLKPIHRLFCRTVGMMQIGEVPERKRGSREEIQRLVIEFEASGLRRNDGILIRPSRRR